MPSILIGTESYHSLDDAAKLLHVSKRTLARRIASGKLGSIRDGRNRWVSDTQIQEYFRLLSVSARAPRQRGRKAA